MLTINEYVKVKSLEEAYELNQKKTNKIIGGMLWLKMGTQRVQTAIDLSGLGLDKIEETEEEFKIGSMTTLRDIEVNEGLNRYTKGAIKESLRHIVGVQFRNCATVGGSIYGRYGFSDVLTMFMALDSYVELYKGGIVALKDFAKMKPDNDIIVSIIVKKKPVNCVYLSERISKTDFPVIAVCVSELDGKFMASVGARPARAEVVFDDENILSQGINDESALKFGEYVSEKLSFNTNMRGSKEFRKHLAKVLVKRGVKAIGGDER